MYSIYLFFLLVINLENVFGYHVAIASSCSSHLYGTSSFAKLLVGKGHKVTYVTSNECKSRFLDTGAQLYMDKKWHVLNMKEVFASSSVITQTLNGIEFFANTSEAMLQELELWLNQDNGIHRPDVIMAPATGVYSSIIADYYNIPFVGFFGSGVKFYSKDNLQKSNSLLPNWMGEDGFVGGSYIQIQWTLYSLLVDIFFSFSTFNNRRAQMQLPKFGNMLHMMRSYPTVTPFYEPFVMHGKIDDFYRISLTSSVKSNDVLDLDVINWLSSSDVPVLYMALGTSTYIEQSMIEMLVEAFEKQSDFRILWSLLEKDGASKSKTKEHVLIRSFLPQITVLQRKEVVGFLSHCGAASLMEAVAIEVPMILFPQGRDQDFNAMQANETGAGIYLPTPTSSDSIINVLKQFKLKREKLQRNIANIRKTIDDKDEWDKFDAAVKELIKRKSSSFIPNIDGFSTTYLTWITILVSLIALILGMCIYITWKCCKCICKRRRKIKRD